MPNSRPVAYFIAEGDRYTPTSIARGPWGQTISGNILGGLLGFVVDRDHGQPDFQPARLTVDLFRPAALAPLTVSTTTVRAGRRIIVIDATALQDGQPVARAGVLYLRRGQAPRTDIWTHPVDMPVPPDPGGPGTGAPMQVIAYGAGTSSDLSAWAHRGPKHVWLRTNTALVDGQPMTPFAHAAIAGDVVSSLTHFGPDGLLYINADYTLTLSRLPEGPDIGLSALTHYADAGVATGTATLFDRAGPIGSGIATALVSPGFAPPPV
ncbi:thioesterase family protein [Mycolicibacterium neoaurum]|uniref:acyl-CoA thioesterase domain-containing protein n=1 Tax=Mycolicibacterium neoaurum TaxID=1795 RepID=UPI00248D1076|nr:acyl-CoA thioesterase domain-containing protein [Mycolicibacterium neoaurum]WBP94021.1 thioesterase family protein [Mycolicibacterium neoaurum]WBS07159.1 thioesterase family protein [Mycolicibacterium neoaurum]